MDYFSKMKGTTKSPPAVSLSEKLFGRGLDPLQASQQLL
jgi:hypothetical protein